jgi:hypothetical protein
MRKYCYLFWGLTLLVYSEISLPLYAKNHKEIGGKANFSKNFYKHWGNKPIKVRQQIFSNQVRGTYPSSSTVERCAERFYKTLDYLPESLILKSRLKYVTFLRNLKLNNQLAGGVANGDTIYLPVDFQTKTVFHEFFHIFDPVRNNKKWCSFNDKSFVYSGSKFYSVAMSSKKRKQVKRNNRKDKIEDSFVSQYAMSFEWEDRAETFAYMIVEGRNFLKRTKNPVIKAKMEYIMDLFIQRDLLDEAFWNNHFDCKFKVRNRLYSNDKK